MGEIFKAGGLTTPNSALINDPSGQQGQPPTFIGSPAQVLSKANAGLPSANAMMGPDVLNPSMQAPKLPTIGTPSFQQAATAGAQPGGVNALSPGLNKAGKLATLLTSGLQGALAGRAAQEQAAVQSGGRRAGGVGMAMEAGYNLPWQRQQTQQGLAQQRAQTGLIQAEQEDVAVPGLGTMPAWLARTVAPAYVRGQSQQAVQGMKGDTAETVANTGAKAKTDVANINQGMQIPVDETVANLAGIPELAGKPVGKGTWGNINKALEAKGYHTQDMGQNGTGENSGMWLMDKGGNRIKQVSPNSLTFQRGASFAQNRPEVVANDPENPGALSYTTAAKAMSQGMTAPGSTSVKVAQKAGLAEVPSKIGDQKVAFNTAAQHAQLLQDTLVALDNGDVKALNSIKNRFKTEFGSADVTNYQTVASAYVREINKMLTGGHVTDSEIADAGAKLPSNASPQQIVGALQSYKNLAQSKLNMLNQQSQSAVRNAQPKKAAAARPQGSAPSFAEWKAQQSAQPQ